MPLFDNQAKEYELSTASTVDWSSESDYLREIVRDHDFSPFHTFDSLGTFTSVFQWLWQRQERTLLRRIFLYLLGLLPVEVPEMGVSFPKLVSTMIAFTSTTAAALATTFTTVERWSDLEPLLRKTMTDGAPKLLLALVTAAEEAQELVVEPFRQILRQAPHLSLNAFAELVKLIALTVRSPDVALDLLLGSLEPESARLLESRPGVVQHFVKNLIGLALDHIDEVKDVRSSEDGLLDLKRDSKDRMVSARLRIDAHSSRPLQLSDHVRLTSATLARNSNSQRLYSMDAIVKTLEQGSVTIECLHPLPHYLEDCSWKLTNCGSFVTNQTMIDSLCRFALEADAYCPIQQQLLRLPTDDAEALIDPADLDVSQYSLNESQNTALRASMVGTLTLLWGPPGTGKSHTIVAILQELLSSEPNRRILVAAPTHNAVDNVMRKYISGAKDRTSSVHPIRVSTDVRNSPRLTPNPCTDKCEQIRKVAEDIRPYTCDAMMGKELAEDFKALKVARKRIHDARLVFTTCIGAALGLLRNEKFNTVIIDEASQQTEPMSLVPLVKSCSKAILVGDHVQLRATVQPLSLVQDYDVSLFERLYHHPGGSKMNIQKVMLDSQYRMHRDICAFSSEEFYNGNLSTAVPDDARPLPESQFPWPVSRHDGAAKARMVFVQCDSVEDTGRKSKGNTGQAKLCQDICNMLLSAPAIPSSPSSSPPPPHSPSYSIAVLTPYTRQVEILRALLPGVITVSSIDGFQGREADVVVFVTVRCNVHAEIGFLKDLRRLNVVMTRARCACVVIGDRKTLAGGLEEEGEEESGRVWRRLVGRLDEVRL